MLVYLRFRTAVLLLCIVTVRGYGGVGGHWTGSAGSGGLGSYGGVNQGVVSSGAPGKSISGDGNEAYGIGSGSEASVGSGIIGGRGGGGGSYGSVTLGRGRSSDVYAGGSPVGDSIVGAGIGSYLDSPLSGGKSIDGSRPNLVVSGATSAIDYGRAAGDDGQIIIVISSGRVLSGDLGRLIGNSLSKGVVRIVGTSGIGQSGGIVSTDSGDVYGESGRLSSGGGYGSGFGSGIGFDGSSSSGSSGGYGTTRSGSNVIGFGSGDSNSVSGAVYSGSGSSGVGGYESGGVIGVSGNNVGGGGGSIAGLRGYGQIGQAIASSSGGSDTNGLGGYDSGNVGKSFSSSGY